MKEVLLIHLGAKREAPIDWLCWSLDSKQIVGSGELPNAEQLAHLQAMAEHRQVIVLLPGEQVTLLKTPLARSQYRQIQSHLTYLFEEQLAGDPEKQHITPVSYEEGMFEAVVVDQTQMDEWLSWFAEADIKPGRWVPDYLALPVAEPATTMLLQYRHGWLIHQYHGICGFVDDDWLDPILAQIRSSDSVLVSDIDAARVGDEWEQKPLNVELPLLTLLDGALVSSVNLLHGRYRQEKASQGGWKNYRWLFASAALVVILAVGQVFVHSWVLQHKVSQGQAQLAKLYEQVYHRKPASPVYALQTFRRMMRQSATGASQQGFLTIMEQLTPAFSKIPELQLRSVSYDDSSHSLALQVRAPSFASFEQFSKAAAPLEVQSGAQSRQGDQVSATLTIREVR